MAPPPDLTRLRAVYEQSATRSGGTAREGSPTTEAQADPTAEQLRSSPTRARLPFPPHAPRSSHSADEGWRVSALDHERVCSAPAQHRVERCEPRRLRARAPVSRNSGRARRTWAMGCARRDRQRAEVDDSDVPLGKDEETQGATIRARPGAPLASCLELHGSERAMWAVWTVRMRERARHAGMAVSAPRRRNFMAHARGQSQRRAIKLSYAKCAHMSVSHDARAMHWFAFASARTFSGRVLQRY